MNAVLSGCLDRFEAPGEQRTYFQKFVVSYEYPVCFTRDLFNDKNTCLEELIGNSNNQSPPRVATYIDDGVLRQFPDFEARIAQFAKSRSGRFDFCFPVVAVPGGEGCKNDPALLDELQRSLVAYGIDRHSYAIAIGGGAVLDLVGYAAATVHRGVRHIRIPTTVLAQNDSGVGVKNGVNAMGMKNLLGSFAPPYAVINDSAFIDILPGREKRAGMAEAVKVALIRDQSFFEWLEQQADELAIFASEPLDRLIRRCAMLHMRQIALGGDPFERGSTRPLDFGHWAAHKLEALSQFSLRHGEAVAIGIALDTHYSVLKGHLPAGQDVRVRRLLEKLGFRLWHEACDQRTADGHFALTEGLNEFREHLGGQLTITLLSDIGSGIEVHEMDEDAISASIEWLRSERTA